MKYCARCKETKPRADFHKNASRADGLQSSCKTCKASMNRHAYNNTAGRRKELLTEQRQARRVASQDHVREYLQTHPCVDCGEDDWIVLDFDHVRGVKYKEISILVGHGYSLPTVVAEIAKCEVRCANCHRRVTAQRAGTWRIFSGSRLAA